MTNILKIRTKYIRIKIDLDTTKYLFWNVYIYIRVNCETEEDFTKTIQWISYISNKSESTRLKTRLNKFFTNNKFPKFGSTSQYIFNVVPITFSVAILMRNLLSTLCLSLVMEANLGYLFRWPDGSKCSRIE